MPGAGSLGARCQVPGEKRGRGSRRCVRGIANELIDNRPRSSSLSRSEMRDASERANEPDPDQIIHIRQNTNIQPNPNPADHAP